MRISVHSLRAFYAYLSVAILDGRQKRAEELRRLTDQSASMSEDQLTELRADIKVCLLLYGLSVIKMQVSVG